MEEYKAAGNAAFGKKEYKEAIVKYSQGLDIHGLHPMDQATLWMNRSACYSKLRQYEDVVADCTSALQVNSMLEKALYRRADALFELEKFPGAFEDIRKVVQLNPKNKAAVTLARKIKDAIISTSNSSSNKTSSSVIPTIFKSIQDLLDNGDLEKASSRLREVATKCKHDTKISQQVIDNELSTLWKWVTPTSSNTTTSSSHCNDAMLVLAEVASHGSNFAKVVYEAGTISLVVNCINNSSSSSTIVAEAAVRLCAHILHYVVSADELLNENTTELTDTLINALLSAISPPSPSNNENEAVITSGLDSLLRICTTKSLVENFISHNLFQSLVSVADTSSALVASRLSLVFSQVFSIIDSDDDVKKYMREICLNVLTSSTGNSANVVTLHSQAAGVLSSVFLVNRDVGLWAVKEPGVIEALHDLCHVGNENSQAISMSVASQVAAMEAGRSLFSEEFFADIARLMNSSSIRVRAGSVSAYVKLAAVSKAFKGESVSGKMVLEAVLQILEYCSTTTHSSDNNSSTGMVFTPKERAIEALSYIIHDTDVKESVVRNANAIRAISHINKDDKPTVAYGTGYILSHIMASEGKLKKKKMAGMDMSPEQYEQLQAALKQQSAFDDGDTDEKVKFRIEKVVENNGIQALCFLCRINSPRTQESAAQSLLHAAENSSVHGKMVQQGAVQALVPLCLILERKKKDSATFEKGNKELYEHTQQYASQALAKILISTNPGLLQSSQLLSTVKPLVNLMKSDQNLLQFEALMALTNVASVGEDAKARILAENGLHAIQYLQFSDHELVRRAATEAICNLLPAQEVVELITKPDKIRLWMAFAGQEEDFELSRAAAGALAMISQMPDAAKAILDNKGVEIFGNLANSSNSELQHRAAFTLNCLSQIEGGVDAIKKTDDIVSRLKELAISSDDPNVKNEATSFIKALL